MNCENCKHWGAEDAWNEPYEGEGYKECRLARTPHKVAGKDERVVTQRHPRSLMAPHGGERGGYLFTAPTFGCIHWDAR